MDYVLSILWHIKQHEQTMEAERAPFRDTAVDFSQQWIF